MPLGITEEQPDEAPTEPENAPSQPPTEHTFQPQPPAEPVSVAPGPKGMGLVPSLFTANPKALVRLNTTSVSLVADTDDAVRDKYREATTGISVPEKKILVG